MSGRFLKRSVAVICALALAIIGYFSIGKQRIQEAHFALLQPNDALLVAQGKEIYAQSCASCHGVTLEGQTTEWRSPGPNGKLPAPPHDETGHTWHHPDSLLFQITKVAVAVAANLENYESDMPAYEGVLSDEEIVAVLSFIKNTWSEALKAQHDKLNEQYISGKR